LFLLKIVAVVSKIEPNPSILEMPEIDLQSLRTRLDVDCCSKSPTRFAYCLEHQAITYGLLRFVFHARAFALNKTDFGIACYVSGLWINLKYSIALIITDEDYIVPINFLFSADGLFTGFARGALRQRK